MEKSAARKTAIKTVNRKQWMFRLYTASKSEKALAAFENLKYLCETYLNGIYSIEVIDLTKNPDLSREDNILAIPTVVRRKPAPVKKVVGDLSDYMKAIAGLDITTD